MDQYKYIRWLSLDIVLGAIFFLSFLENYYEVSLSWHAHAALGSAIWLIYTVDHLMDSRMTNKPSTARHAFHKKHFKVLVLLAGTVLVLALVNVYFLQVEVIRYGAILSAICVSYLLLVYFIPNLWVKEFLVAAVYAGGIFLGPLSQVDGIAFNDVILVMQLALVALLNLVIFSFYDRHTDRSDGFHSIALQMGEPKSKKLIGILGAVVALSTAFMGVWDILQVLYLLMTSVLLLIFYLPGIFSRNSLYRTVGDGVFYLPGLMLWLT